MEYITCCVHAEMQEILDLQASGRQITYRTALQHIGRDALAQVFSIYDWSRKPRDLTLKKDWMVRYYRGVFRGKPVVYVQHSRIEYIFG